MYDSAVVIFVILAIAVLVLGLICWNVGSESSPERASIASGTTHSDQYARERGAVGSDGKVVALLDLSGDGVVSNDISIAVSLQYISNLNDFPITIIDTKSDLANLTNLVQEYYDLGYRTFIGFSASYELAAVLPWFLDHADTIGISLSSTAISLNVNKNVIRLQTNDVFNAFFIAQFINYHKYANVLFIGDPNDLAATNLYSGITAQLAKGINTELVVVNNLTVDQTSIDAVTRVLQDLRPNTIVVPLLSTRDSEAYQQIVVDTLPESRIPVHISTIGTEPVFTGTQSQSFAEKYFFIDVSYIPSLTNQELAVILGKNFSQNAFDAFNIARIASTTADKSEVYSLVDHLLGHTGSLELNNFSDRKYSFFIITQWTGVRWVAYWVSGNVPNIGIFIADVLTNQFEI